MGVDRALLPALHKIGRPRKWRMGEIWNAIRYIAAAGCQWAMLPKDFPPFTTVRHYYYRLRDSGMFDIINETLVMSARLPAGRTAGSSSAALPGSAAAAVSQKTGKQPSHPPTHGS